jgi:hypothetical protein
MNTSRAGSNMPCSRIQRRRARATSGRSCSAACRLFFEADPVAGEQPPDRAVAAGDPSLAHCDHDFIQRQIRLLGNQGQQPIRVLFQRRNAPTGRLSRDTSSFLPALQPFHRRTGTDIQAFSRFASRRSRYPKKKPNVPMVRRSWRTNRTPPALQRATNKEESNTRRSLGTLALTLPITMRVGGSFRYQAREPAIIAKSRVHCPE